MDEIIEYFEFEEMMKDITLGGTEFRCHTKHKRNKEVLTETELSY